MRLLLAMTALLFASCGYTSIMRLPDGYETIGLEVFDNPSDLRNLEADLYQAMSQSMMQYVAAPLASPGTSDLVIRGRVVEYRRRGGVRNELNRLSETGVRITLEAHLYDPSTGRQVGESVQATQEIGYIVGEGTLDTSTIDETRRDPTLEREAERIARNRALRLASEEIVFELFATPAPRPIEES